MPGFADAELDQRGIATLLASWEAYARGTTGAMVQRFPGVTAAIFLHVRATAGPARQSRSRRVPSRDRRRRLSTIHLHDALARDCQTASLQSTPMAERVYATAGFRDLGRILEYVR